MNLQEDKAAICLSVIESHRNDLYLMPNFNGFSHFSSLYESRTL